ncbi:MAG TPA: ProQ/FINO family protein [Gammaproteobacteria bacterium]|nr:ProQ/FINO family protein [Gammaproteobacteria bacterium]
MSNLSLKEQLKALSLGSPSSHEPQPKKNNKKIRRSPQGNGEKIKQRPAWLEHAQYGVELLKAHFPNCFKEFKEIRPLKVGIKQDLVKHLSGREDIVIGDKACMVNSLAYYVNSIAYHKSMIEGSMRIDLDGKEMVPVTAEEAQYSSECRKTKLQKKRSEEYPVTELAQIKR